MEDVPWGTGDCDVRSLMIQLKAQDFKGYLMIEYEHGSIDELMRNLPKCIQFFNQPVGELAVQ
jgi:L-ribulose-5-phosphate 3-epimerase